jgi:hypothetical protein
MEVTSSEGWESTSKIWGSPEGSSYMFSGCLDPDEGRLYLVGQWNATGISQ